MSQLADNFLKFFYANENLEYYFIIALISVSFLFLRKYYPKVLLFKGREILVTFLLLFLLLLVGGISRMFDINSEFTGYYAFRQTQTLMVYRNYKTEGITPFKTKLDMIFPDQDEYEGYVDGFEFNFLPIVTVYFTDLFEDIPAYYRMVIILFNLIGISSIFFILKGYFGKFVSFFGTMLYALLPMSIYFGQAYKPDIPSQSLFLLGIFVAQKVSLTKDRRLPLLIIANILVALAILMKPQTLLMLPIFTIVLLKHDIKLDKKYLFSKKFLTKFLSRFLQSVFPLVALAGFMFIDLVLDADYKYPHELLSLSAFTTEYAGILFNYAHFYTISIIGIIFAIFGLIENYKEEIQSKFTKNPEIILGWCVFTFLFVVILFRGYIINVYYQINLLPAAIILISFAFYKLNTLKLTYLIPIFTFVILRLTFSFTNGWFTNAFDRPEVVEAGDFIKNNTEEDAIVVISDFVSGEPTGLYYTDRKGYITNVGLLKKNDLEEYIDNGADYLVVHDRFYKDLENNIETKDYLTNKAKYVFETFTVYNL